MLYLLRRKNLPVPKEELGGNPLKIEAILNHSNLIDILFGSSLFHLFSLYSDPTALASPPPPSHLCRLLSTPPPRRC
jgi:hypothetical protein